jgi:LAGLIDADG-like domain
MNRENIPPQLSSAKKEAAARFLTQSARAAYSTRAVSYQLDLNIVGVGIGKKIKGGQPTGTDAVRVYVNRKFPKAQIPQPQLVPSAIRGVPTDVVETGRFRAFAMAPPPSTPRDRFRPIRPGTSIGPPPIGNLVEAGTLGAIVKSGGAQYILSNNHVLCYSEDTEVLTEEGWKSWPSVSPEDKLATRDNSGVLVYQNPSRIFSSTYAGPMLRFASKHADLLVTPDHKVFASKGWIGNRKTENFLLVPAKEIVKELTLRKSVIIVMTSLCEWHCTKSVTMTIPSVKYNKGGDYNVRMPVPLTLWASFLGWYIAEGSCAINPSGEYIVSIRNLDKTYQDEIRDILKQMGFNPFILKGGAVVVNSKQLYSFLKPLGTCGSKFIPKDVKELPPAALQAFAETYLKGDGYESKNHVGGVTKSKRLADDLQEVFLKLGYHSQVKAFLSKAGYKPGQTYWRITAYKRSSFRVRVEEIPYSGRIFCATVPNHVLLVRRNGKPIWSGNSDENRLPLGTAIFQPALLDKGSQTTDKVAALSKAVPLSSKANNTVDCAIAAIDKDVAADPTILPKVGKLASTSPIDATDGMKVHKVGRTTGYTTGSVLDISADVNIQYDIGTLTFQGQILIAPDMGQMFSDAGDSGSLIVDRGLGRATGLLFGGSPKSTIANHISDVLTALQIQLTG